VRRATARRASDRRATARNRQGDTDASIIDFLARHPGSTAGDLAKGLNLNPGNVSPRLNQLAKAGEIKKASHGYTMM
jgi:DNA-binding MarR family transcriptional regulator